MEVGGERREGEKRESGRRGGRERWREKDVREEG